MHISLDQALGRQPRLNRVGQSLLNIASGASAAYSLRSLTGGDPKVVNVRRDADDEEREFTSTEVGTELADWVNGLQETTLPADVASSAAAYSLRKVRSAYTGNAVQIRRTSDNVEVDVAFDDNGEVSDSSAITNVTEETSGSSDGSTTATTLGAFIDEDVTLVEETSFPTDTGEFNSTMSGVASYTAGVTFEGKTNVLRAEHDGSGLFGINFTTGNVQIGDVVQYSFSMYFPSTNTGTGGNLKIRTGATSIGGPDVTISSLGGYDNWITFSGTFTVSTNTPTQLTLSTNPTGLASGDVVYFENGSYKIVNGQRASVVTWYDQSGNSNDATQDTSGNQPLIAESGTLKDHLDFDGTDDSLQTTSPWGITGTSDRSIFAVINSDNVSGVAKSYIGMGDNTNLLNAQKWDLSSEFAVRVQGGNEVYQYGATGTDYLVTNIHSGTNVTDNSCFVNGTEQTATSSSAVTINTSNTVCRIGRYGGDFDDPSTHFDGRIQEVIIYASDQSSNRFKIESNINNHYGIYTAAEDGFVETWFDQSGNGNNAVQTTEADQPTIVSSGSLVLDADGNPSIEFDAINDFLDCNARIVELSQNAATVVSVSDKNSQTQSDAGYICSEGDSVSPYSSNFILGGDDGNELLWVNATEFGGATSGNQLIAFTWNGTDSFQAYVDGATSGAAGNATVNAETSNTIIGATGDGTTANSGRKITELISWKEDQTANIAEIQDNINAHYNIYS